LGRDLIAAERVAALSPRLLRETMGRWRADGMSAAVVGGRFRVLRAALGWGWGERLVDAHPIRAMRGPARPEPRRPLADEQVRALLQAAEVLLLEAVANDTGAGVSARRARHAEQALLLVRLAADTGARRGELAGLRVGDLSGRVLTISRAFSAGVLTTPKSGRARNVTVGATTAALWHTLVGQWAAREGRLVGPWLFSADPEHRVPARAERLGRWFDEVRDAAGVREASLHRLRHSVATFLVARGQILQAQARLGHADAATTLRVYAHALPGADLAVADAIEDHLQAVDDKPAATASGEAPTV
jgi:integrase